MDPWTAALGIAVIVLCLVIAWLSWTAASKTWEAKFEKKRADGLAKEVENLEKALLAEGGLHEDMGALDRIIDGDIDDRVLLADDDEDPPPA